MTEVKNQNNSDWSNRKEPDRATIFSWNESAFEKMINQIDWEGSFSGLGLGKEDIEKFYREYRPTPCKIISVHNRIAMWLHNKGAKHGDLVLSPSEWWDNVDDISNVYRIYTVKKGVPTIEFIGSDIARYLNEDEWAENEPIIGFSSSDIKYSLGPNYPVGYWADVPPPLSHRQSQPGTKIYTLKVPAGVFPGKKFNTSINGRRCRCVCPAGAYEGMPLNIRVPDGRGGSITGGGVSGEKMKILLKLEPVAAKNLYIDLENPVDVTVDDLTYEDGFSTLILEWGGLQFPGKPKDVVRQLILYHEYENYLRKKNPKTATATDTITHIRKHAGLEKQETLRNYGLNNSYHTEGRIIFKYMGKFFGQPIARVLRLSDLGYHDTARLSVWDEVVTIDNAMEKLKYRLVGLDTRWTISKLEDKCYIELYIMVNEHLPNDPNSSISMDFTNFVKNIQKPSSPQKDSITFQGDLNNKTTASTESSNEKTTQTAPLYVPNNTSKISVLNYHNRLYNSHTVPIASDTSEKEEVEKHCWQNKNGRKRISSLKYHRLRINAIRRREERRKRDDQILFEKEKLENKLKQKWSPQNINADHVLRQLQQKIKEEEEVVALPVDRKEMENAIAEILKGCDLSTLPFKTVRKTVRKQLEAKFSVQLKPVKDEITKMIMYVFKTKKF